MHELLSPAVLQHGLVLARTQRHVPISLYFASVFHACEAPPSSCTAWWSRHCVRGGVEPQFLVGPALRLSTKPTTGSSALAAPVVRSDLEPSKTRNIPRYPECPHGNSITERNSIRETEIASVLTVVFAQVLRPEGRPESG